MNPEYEDNRLIFICFSKVVKYLKEHGNEMITNGRAEAIMGIDDDNTIDEVLGCDWWDLIECSDLEDTTDWSTSEQWSNTTYGFYIGEDLLCIDTCDSENNGLEAENWYLGQKVPKEDYCLRRINL